MNSMNNLFSTFDPTTNFYFSLNWLSVSILILFTPSFFWITKSKWTFFFVRLTNLLHFEFKMIFGNLYYPGITFISVTLFFFIFMGNFLGLFPYIFTASSHMVFTLTLSLPLWMGHMLMAFWFNFNATMAHFVPLSTPMVLAPFMVLIEMISSIIRPLTLAVRLAANMIAGHLLLTLLSNSIIPSSYLIMSLILAPLLILSILEMAVSIIQGYVFSLLSTLYLNEVNSKALK